MTSSRRAASTTRYDAGEWPITKRSRKTTIGQSIERSNPVVGYWAVVSVVSYQASIAVSYPYKVATRSRTFAHT